MEVSYVPMAKARGFTTHWIKSTTSFLERLSLKDNSVLKSVPRSLASAGNKTRSGYVVPVSHLLAAGAVTPR